MKEESCAEGKGKCCTGLKCMGIVGRGPICTDYPTDPGKSFWCFNLILGKLDWSKS